MPDEITPPTTPPATPPVQPTATPPSPPGQDWTHGFDEVQKGYIQNKGFKGPKDVLDSYQNFEKLMGAPKDRLLTLPENLDTPEGRAVFERLGTPKDAKGYNLQTPKDGGDPKLTEWAAETFLKAGLPRTMAEKVLDAWNQRSATNKASEIAAKQAQIKDADTALRQEWGAAYDKNKNLMNSAATVGGISQDEMAGLSNVIGPKRAAELMLKVGNSLTEATFITGGQAGDGLQTPDQAMNKIAELRSDKDFTKRLMSGDAAARKEWDNAHKMARPGDIRIG